MDPQNYIKNQLAEIGGSSHPQSPADAQPLEEHIFKLLLSKKFRKYSAAPQLIEHITNAIHINVQTGKPINLTFPQGSYKLWRLDESPEVDWAELFALMYYSDWLKPICEIYEPGVWVDFFVDDLIVPKIDNIPPQDIEAYRLSFQKLIDWLKPYQPPNLKMTITSVGSQFTSPEAFDQKLDQDIVKYKAGLPGGLPELTDAQIATIDLNARPTEEQRKDPLWREKVTLIHDAYITKTKVETGYHNQPSKIKIFTLPQPSGMFLVPGATKDSVVKFWVGVGALKPRDGSFRQIVLPPSQLKDALFTETQIDLGIPGKNFHKIRILKS